MKNAGYTDWVAVAIFHNIVSMDRDLFRSATLLQIPRHSR